MNTTGRSLRLGWEHERPSKRAELWRQVVAQQERSGQSVGVFCQQRGWSAASFYGWRKRVKQEAAVTFALVESQRASAMIEVALASGERLRIPCEAAALRVVLSVLREAGA